MKINNVQTTYSYIEQSFISWDFDIIRTSIRYLFFSRFKNEQYRSGVCRNVPGIIRIRFQQKRARFGFIRDMAFIKLLTKRVRRVYFLRGIKQRNSYFDHLTTNNGHGRRMDSRREETKKIREYSSPRISLSRLSIVADGTRNEPFPENPVTTVSCVTVL